MKTTFEPGDRITWRDRYDWSEIPVILRGVFLVGPGEHPTDRPGNFLVIGQRFALVKFDEEPDPRIVKLDNLKPEES